MLKATIVGMTRRHLLQGSIETSLDRCLNRDNRTTIFGRIRLSTTVLEKYEIGKIISITLATTRFIPSALYWYTVLGSHQSESSLRAALFTRTKRTDRESRGGLLFIRVLCFFSTTLRLYLRISIFFATMIKTHCVISKVA